MPANKKCTTLMKKRKLIFINKKLLKKKYILDSQIMISLGLVKYSCVHKKIK